VLNMRLLALLIAVMICPNMGAFAQKTAHASAVLLELSQPVYPPLARQANIYGDVSVGVKVHPDGKTEVVFEQGHPMLKQSALDSAQKSRFECRECDSTVTYRLVYSFRLAKGSDCCSAISVPAHVTLEPQSSDQDMQQQARITITADEICLCDPPAQLTKKSRSLKCLYLWNCS
jgi:TonB family protein